MLVAPVKTFAKPMTHQSVLIMGGAVNQSFRL